MLYPALYLTHVATVILSIGLFLLRGLWILGGSGPRGGIVVRVLPHVIDTLLLASAIGLAVLLRQYPLDQPWITAKVVGLVVYIGLGTVALKRRKAWAFVLALLTFAYIVAVALSRNPVPLG